MPRKIIQLSEADRSRFGTAVNNYKAFDPDRARETGTQPNRDRIGIGAGPGLMQEVAGDTTLADGPEPGQVEGDPSMLLGVTGWVVRELLEQLGQMAGEARDMYHFDALAEMDLPGERTQFFGQVDELAQTLSRFARLAISLEDDVPKHDRPSEW